MFFENWLKRQRRSYSQGVHRSSLSAKRRQSRRLRLEPLETRELLAFATAIGGLRYEATGGETNNVILSPGAMFSIQDSADVAQFGLGGCVPSDFLRGMGISVDVSAGTSLGIGAEVEVGAGIGFGMPLFVNTRLPDGMICPTPSGLSTPSGVGDSVQDAFNRMTQGVSSAVAGVPVTQAGSIFYKVSASTGTLAQYGLYQAIVDPATALTETESNDRFGTANAIAASTLVQGTLPIGADDVDFYKFNANSGDRVAILLDADPEKDGKVTNTKITLYGRDGSELFSNISFNTVNAVGAVVVPPLPLTGPLYLSVESPGYAEDGSYRFVLVKTNSGLNENQAKPMTFASGNLSTAIPDANPSGIAASLPVDVGNVFARADNLEVTVNLSHTYDSDLRLYLETPGGTLVSLVEHRGGSGDHFTSTVFKDSALTSIITGSAPFTGEFRPEQALSSVAGELINGTWKLHVIDDVGGDVGTLDNWSLTFRVATNDTPGTADPLAAAAFAQGAVPSSADVDFFEVGGATTSSLLFAYVDTHDLTRDPNAQNNNDPTAIDSFLEVYANDGTTLLASDDDSGPLVSNQNYDSFNKQLDAAGVDLGALSAPVGGAVTIDLKDGNDTCDASKLNLIGQEIRILGGDGNDTILGPGGDHVTLDAGQGYDTFVFNNDSHAVVTLNGGGGGNDTLQVNGTTGNDLITVQLSPDQQDLVITVNGIIGIYKNIAGASIENLAIDGRGGDDIVTVDSSNGAIVFANGTGIVVEGGASQIRFTSGLTVAESNRLAMGPIPGSGTSTIVIAGQTQVVAFTAPNPVATTLISDSVFGALEFQATGANNAIDLGSASSPAASLLQVDHQAFVELSNKIALTIGAGAGADTVHLHLGAQNGLIASLAPLLVNGEGGEDTIAAEDGLEALLAITLSGGADHDSLTAGGALLGGSGDDVLVAGPGASILDGGDGDDCLIGGRGSSQYLGGDGLDTIVVQGTPANDQIAVTQNSADGLTRSILTAGVSTSVSDSFTGVEALRIDAGRGDDSILVTHADTLVTTPGASLPITVVGDEPEASDRLAVIDDGLGDVTILRQARDGHSGSITVGPLAPIAFSGIERVDLLPVNATTDGYGSDGLGRLVVISADPMEANDSRRVATPVDVALRTQVSPSIDPVSAPHAFSNAGDLPADEDWYRFTAPKTGTFQFLLDYQAIGRLGNNRAGLPGDGLLRIEVYDAAGRWMRPAREGRGSQTNGLEKGRTYYLRVFGETAQAVNVYDLKVVDVDVFGPQVTHVAITDRPDFNLFANKQANGGSLAPTPLIHSLTITVRDDVWRRPGFLYPALNEALCENPGHFRLVGDNNGVIPINPTRIDVHNNPVTVGKTPTATITLYFDQPLPDDRYTLTLSDSLVDPAGNKLDGESNALEPNGAPRFPSGDTAPGGSFVARFTVDSRPEIGVWAAGSVYVDTNGNFQYDPQNADFVNRDYTYVLGYTSDQVFAGNFAAPGQNADGFDKLAVYGKVGDLFRWSIDTDNDGVPDLIQTDPANLIGMPVAGNFDGNAANGDEVGLFDGTSWYLDRNHDFMVQGPGDLKVTNGEKGYPLVGDFDGDGKADLGSYLNGVFSFDFASNGYGAVDTTMDVGYMGFLGARTRPVATDMDQDGITDIGLWVPDRSGANPDKLGEWYWLISDDMAKTKRQPASKLNDPDPLKRRQASAATLNATLNHAFSLLPPAKDVFARFGNEFSVPVVGNFDPPVSQPNGSVNVPPGPVTVNFAGTDGSDRFSFSPGATSDSWVLTLNGTAQTIVGSSIEVTFDGGGGGDQVTLVGGDGDDTASLGPLQGTLLGLGYKVSVQNAASISLDARGGVNTVSLFGSSGTDALSISAAEASMSGPGFANRVKSFTTLDADGGGGHDLARVQNSVLTGPLGPNELGSVPSAHQKAAWLSNFDVIQRKNNRAQGGNRMVLAADQVFAAYW